MSKRLLVLGSIIQGRPVLLVKTATLVAQGFYFPTCLQLKWEPVVGPWLSDKSACSRN